MHGLLLAGDRRQIPKLSNVICDKNANVWLVELQMYFTNLYFGPVVTET